MDDKTSFENRELFSMSYRADERKTLTQNSSKLLDINSDLNYQRRLTTNELVEAMDYINKKDQRSLNYYNKFVNQIKKVKSNIKTPNENNQIKEDNNGKFMNIVNRMMDHLMLNNNSYSHSIKTSKNKKRNSYQKQLNYNKNYKDSKYIKYILLIQRKYKQYKNKKELYNKLLNEKEKYLSINDLKKLNKEELEKELYKYMNKNKELFDIIEYYKKKINFIQLELKNYKEKFNENYVFQTENQKIINYNKKINIKGVKKEKYISKENKKILRSKNFSNARSLNKKVTIFDKKDKNLQISKYNNNNENMNNIKIFKSQNEIKQNNENKKEKKEKKENKDNNDDKKIENNNIGNKNEQKDKNENKKELEENPLEKKERLKKSRGLRKLLTKKGKEKKEILRKYFVRFYLAGLYASIRQGVRKRTLEKKERNRSADHIHGKISFENNNNNILDFSNNEDEIEDEIEKEKNKRNKLLTKIIYRKDRVVILIMKKTLEKLNLRAKLISLKQNKKERITRSKSKIKKKGKHKSKSLNCYNINKVHDNNEDKKH